MTDKGLISWLILTFRLPLKPSAPRVRVWRQLQNLGAAALRESVYVLPENEETLEDFHWLQKEISAMNGEVVLFRGKPLFGMREKEIIEIFHGARDKAYKSLIEESTKLLEMCRNTTGRDGKISLPPLRRTAHKLRQEYDLLQKRDFFSAPLKKEARSLITSVEKELEALQTVVEKAGRKKRESVLRVVDFQRKIWVTRKNPFIDRIASAWLIKNFIDSRATFAFVGEQSEVRKGIFFDMDETQFTHCGENCTFETILNLFALTSPALTEIAQIVHDIDLKDGKYSRQEAAGIEQILQGFCRIHSDDHQLLKKGMEIFDSLYGHFTGVMQPRNKEKEKKTT